MSFEIVQSLASKLHCKVGNFPFLYLGLPIVVKSRGKVVWDPVVKNFEWKLSLWISYLSLGGMITLIKAALSILPIHVPFAYVGCS